MTERKAAAGLQRILVPLDGSQLAEAAIPLAESLARAQGATLSLVRVVEPLPWTLIEGDYGESVDPELYHQLESTVNDEADEYLARVAERLRANGISVQTERRGGFVASVLLGCEKHLQPDLIVMASHGRTGLARFTLGSVADRMVREGTVPVLLARSFNPTVNQLENALVPLDGSPLAEEVLPMVETLAGRPLQAIHLLRAVADSAKESTASEYLDRVAERLEPLGVQIFTVVADGPPADVIAQEAERVDLVMLSTHGRGGLDRLRHGSVAEQAMRQLTTPTLLVRARASDAIAPHQV